MDGHHGGFSASVSLRYSVHAEHSPVSETNDSPVLRHGSVQRKGLKSGWRALGHVQ